MCLFSKVYELVGMIKFVCLAECINLSPSACLVCAARALSRSFAQRR